MTLKISANDYAKHSVIARIASERMLSRLEWINFTPKVILDAGCRVGFGADQLKTYYAHANIIAMDHAISFLKYARHDNKGYWLQGNVFQAPFFNHSIDLVFANLLLPWCHDIPALLQEWRRILRPHSLLIFTALGPDTLSQLHDKVAIIPNLPDMHEIGDMLTSGGWIDPVLDVEFLTLSYKTSEDLCHELLQTEMIEEPPEVIETCQSTYEIIYGLAWSPDLSAGYAADEAGVTRIPLSHLRYNKKR